MEGIRQLVLNRVRCMVCGEMITSYHPYDYQRCGCDQQTMVDGGLDYQRYGGVDLTKVDTSYTVYADEPFEKVRKFVRWGTYGKSGKEPLRYVYLNEMSDDHVKNILTDPRNIGAQWVRLLFDQELEYRKQNNITIND